jgi:hypothetical protein
MVVTLLALLPTATALRAQDAAECDALAGALGDAPEPEALETAQAACSEAVRTQPGSMPLLHLYARTLELSGDLDGATRLYQWAADDGYEPAAQALARLEGAPAEGSGAVETAASETPEAAVAGSEPPEAAADGSEPGASDAVGPAVVQAAEQLDQFAALLERARGLLPRTSFDPAAVVSEVGTDPQALAQWVGSQTALIPYRGRLRGPVGVLLDRYGSSLDRALLLAVLVEAAGHEAVLVHGTLSEADATRLLTVRPQPTAIAADPRTPETVLAELGIDPAADPLRLAAVMAEDAAAGTEMRATVAAQARIQGDALLGLVSSLAAPAGNRAAEIEALRDYWWVRVDGTQDLDPGGLLAAVTGAEAIEPDALPPELSHAVTLTVIAEFVAEGGLRSETLLSHTLFPAELAGTSVLLWHEPIALPGPEELLAGGDADAVARAIIDERSWQPALLIGDEVFADRIATVDGQVLPGDEDGVAAARVPFEAAGDVGNVASGLGSDLLGGAEPSAPAAPTAELAAMWLEMGITGPGLQPVTHRRAVFDLVGAAARSAGAPIALVVDDEARRRRAEALLEYVDVGIWGATPSTAFISDATARDLGLFLTRMADLLRAGALEPAALPGLGELPRLQLMLQSFAAARTGLAGSSGLVLEQTNVMLVRQGRPLAGDGAATGYAMIDIVENGVAQVAAPAAGAFAARLRQGVADTALESALLGSPDPSLNASAQFASDLAAGRNWVALSSRQDVEALRLPADASAQIAAALDEGYLAVAPPGASGPVTWWRVDLALGTTLGIGPTGGGSETSEYLVLIGKLMGIVGCGLGTVSAINTGANAAASYTAFGFCMLGMGASSVISSMKIVAGSASAAAGGMAAADAATGLVGAVGGLGLGVLGL